MPSGARLGLGGRVEGGGGVLSEDAVEVTIPAECFKRSPDREIAVFNADDDPVGA